MAAFLLLPFSLLYMLGDWLNRHMHRPYRPKARVICVGNLTLGGTGKTPLVIHLAERLMRRGLRVGIISRGYGGRLGGARPVLVDVRKHGARDVGDEPFLIASKLNVPVAIGADRAGAARLVEKKADVIVMDDGLQNYTLEQDVRICVFDGMKGMGNGFVFPAGPLRQSPSACLWRIDAAVVMGAKNAALERRIGKHVRAIFHAKTVPPADLKRYRGRRAVAFAGIGNPAKFFRMLAEAGVRLERKIAFGDHHCYRPEELEFLIGAARGDRAILLTTAKDYVKIPPPMRKGFIPVDIGVAIENEGKLLEMID
ncbi:MAG: tetraacyldisaccharide 4'-kinase [Rickettsiales bacterium]|nr:tetraacyldisaccharide 4'-kinase [Rickettsiales bacterium]